MEIKRTRDFTAFIANSTGAGRVHPSDVVRGKLAIVPESMEFGLNEPEPVRPVDRQAVGRSVVTDGGLFDAGMRGRMR